MKRLRIYIHRSYEFFIKILFKFFNKFVKAKDNKVIIMSFGGKGLVDSPVEIYRKLITDDRFNDYEITWALSGKEYKNKRNRKDINVVNANSLKYIIELLKAKTWITNVGMGRGTHVYFDNYLVINTWHGTPLKKIGSDVFGNSKIGNNGSIYLYQTEYEKSIFMRVFNINSNQLKKFGLPRNDGLFNSSNLDIENIKRKLSIPEGKQIIMYAPTWRDNSSNCYIDLLRLKNEVREDQMIIFRGHHAMSSVYDNEIFDENLIDLSSYSNLNDLLLITDIMITDYSSIFVDYSILSRPILLFIPDIIEYTKERGLYFDIEDEFRNNCVYTEDDLIKILRSNDVDTDLLYKDIVAKFRIKGGNATVKTVDFIYETLKGSNNES